jgi:hypothetical protein
MDHMNVKYVADGGNFNLKTNNIMKWIVLIILYEVLRHILIKLWYFLILRGQDDE